MHRPQAQDYLLKLHDVLQNKSACKTNVFSALTAFSPLSAAQELRIFRLAYTEGHSVLKRAQGPKLVATTILGCYQMKRTL